MVRQSYPFLFYHAPPDSVNLFFQIGQTHAQNQMTDFRQNKGFFEFQSFAKSISSSDKISQ